MTPPSDPLREASRASVPVVPYTPEQLDLLAKGRESVFHHLECDVCPACPGCETYERLKTAVPKWNRRNAHPAPDPPSGEAALTLEQTVAGLREIRVEANQPISDASIENALREMRASLEWIAKRAERALLAAPETEKR